MWQNTSMFKACMVLRCEGKYFICWDGENIHKHYSKISLKFEKLYRRIGGGCCWHARLSANMQSVFRVVLRTEQNCPSRPDAFGSKKVDVISCHGSLHSGNQRCTRCDRGHPDRICLLLWKTTDGLMPSSIIIFIKLI